jgi:diguanylate cyclase (GGDEF)-like protein
MTGDNHTRPPAETLADDALLRNFVDEAREHLDQVEPDLLALEEAGGEQTQAALNRILRAVHSIKGAAALVGLPALRDLGHLVENVLTRLRSGEMRLEPAVVDHLLAALDRLRQMVELPPAEQRLPGRDDLPGLYALQAAPAAPAQALAASGPAPSAATAPPAGPATLHPLAREVLVVEDNQLTSRLLCQRIAADTGLNPVPVYTLAQARELLEAGRSFFVGVLDLNLPDAPDGEVVDLALAHGLAPIILTATFSDQMRQRMLAKSVVDYVVKGGPRDLEYVTRLINRLRQNLEVTVLVVDDTRPIRELVAGLLRLQGYQVLAAGDGRQALEVYAEHPEIALVVTDYQMPEVDGLELVASLRGQASQDRLAIIGISAEGSSSLPARFLKAGANDFLPKPFQSEEFHSRVGQHVELLGMIRRIKELSRRDYLTQVYSRRWLFEAGRKLLARAQERDEALAVGLIDIDHFKRVNDTYGHAAGDQALQHLARLMLQAFPPPALVARVGGEEFCVLAPGLDRAKALLAFNQLRRQVERAPVITEAASLGLTISVGVVADLRGSLDQVLTRADDLLYQAKAGGRNRVILA